jgi:flagellar hook-associated protein 2
MASVDGLVSGLDTTTIISQLMQLERQPQTRLKARQATVETAIGALRNLNTKFLAVTTAAAKLQDSKGWAPATATSSDVTKVAVTASPGAVPGSLSIKVGALAAAGSWLSESAKPGLGSPVAAAGTTLHVKKADGSYATITTGDGSLAAVMKALNASDAGVTATSVQVTPGQHRLKLEAATTGARPPITIGTTPGADDGLSMGTYTQLVAPANAELWLGNEAITRSSNTITDLLSGVTVTLLQADPPDGPRSVPPTPPTGPPTTISVKADADKVAAQVSALVDAVNAVASDVKAVTGVDGATGSKGKLHGDGTIRSLRDRLLGAISGPGTAAAGVSIDRAGIVSFDKEKFLRALAADPVAVQQALGAGTPEIAATATTPVVPAVPGLAERLFAVADGASRRATHEDGPGLIASSISSRESRIRTIKTSISGWDGRLEQREATLKRQYAALERALGSSQSQGQWLAGQISGLPKWS